MNVFIDIGTNLLQGYNQISVLEGINDDWKKIFIEPNPECWEEIEEKIKNLKNAFFYKNAMYIDKKTVTLLTRNDFLKDTGATIMGKKFLDDSLARWGMSAEYNSYEIETVTLEEVFKNINPEDLVTIKLDAEGIEYELIEEILNKSYNVKKIYCEFHVHNQEDLIRKNNLISRIIEKIELIEWH